MIFILHPVCFQLQVSLSDILALRVNSWVGAWEIGGLTPLNFQAPFHLLTVMKDSNRQMTCTFLSVVYNILLFLWTRTYQMLPGRKSMRTDGMLQMACF